MQAKEEGKTGGEGDQIGANLKSKGVENGVEHVKVLSDIDLASRSKDIEDELLDASLNEYQLYLDQLDASKAHLDNLLTDTTTTLDLLTELSSSFRTIEAQTTSFQSQSQTLLASQNRSEKLASDIRGHLQYYEHLEPITRRLNAPGAGNSVRGRSFSEMLVQLDEAIDYMQSHPKEKESESYRSRYKQLLTRALTLIRGHFVSALRDTAADVSNRIADRQLNDTTMSALLYAKFRVGAEEMKSLGLEIQKRASAPADADPDVEGEYQSLMNELHTNFSATRGKLIIPLIRKKLTDIAQAPSTSTDLIKFARASISYIRGICLDEFELWGEWFHGQRGLYDFLESICEPLYDHLRPRIIHESKLTKLCQLCILLQTRYMMQDPEDEVDQVQMPDPNQLDFAALIRPALEDTQTRIVFRTQAIVRNEIEFYKPKAEDLDYPQHFLRRQGAQQQTKPKGPVLSGRKDPIGSATPLTPILKDPMIVDADVSDDEDDRTTKPLLGSHDSSQPIYPTLTLCLTLLTRLHRLINTSIFDDLAHQIVHQTLLSLTAASTQIPKPHKDKTSTLPSTAPQNLFLLTHYLHLKTHLLAFDISSQNLEPDVSFDFSGPLNTFAELRERGVNLFNPVNLMRLISNGTLLPRVVENMLDAKLELDGRLRSVINDFVGDWSNLMTQDLRPLPLPKPPTKSKGNAPTVLDTQRSHAGKMLSKTLASIQTRHVPLLRQTLSQWILEPPSQPRVKETLVAAILENVVRSYEIWWDALPADLRAASSSSASAAKGKQKATTEEQGGEEQPILDPDAFESWAASIFAVRHFLPVTSETMDSAIGGEEDDSRSRDGADRSELGLGLGIHETEEPGEMDSDDSQVVMEDDVAST